MFRIALVHIALQAQLPSGPVPIVMFIRMLISLTVFTHAMSALSGAQAAPSARLSRRYRHCRPHNARVNGTQQNEYVSQPWQNNNTATVTSTPVVAPFTPTPISAPSSVPPPPPARPSPSPSSSAVTPPEQQQAPVQPAPVTPAGNSQGPFHGEGTHYQPGMGACGKTNSASDPVVAVSHLLYDTFPGATPANTNLNPICGRKVKVTWKGGVAHGVLVDRCEGCAYNDIDMSLIMWQQLGADPAIGRLSDNISGSDGKPTVSVDWVWE